MEKLTLTYVGRFTTDKNGQPLMTKAGKPYTSLRIKTNEHGDKYLSGFDGNETKNWKVGDVVEVEVEQKGEYLNFSVPKANHRPNGGMSEEQFALLNRKLDAINTNILRVWAEVDPLKNMTSAGTPVPDFTPKTMNEPPVEAFSDADFAEVDPADIPF